jgi:adenylate cyclase
MRGSLPAVSSGVMILAMHFMLGPLTVCLQCVRSGKEPSPEVWERARRRLLNLPFLFVPVSLMIWLVIPFITFLTTWMLGFLDLRTALILSARTSMVGFVASALGFFGIESHIRRRLVPFFFPHGHLADLQGTARISISRRIRMLYRLGNMIPLTILLVTLITLQWELEVKSISAEQYGREIILFTMILIAVFFFVTGVINRMVSKSIVTPIQYMLDVIPKIREGDLNSRIKVVGNDEIGILGDVGNGMIRGLADREMIRASFGRYVTPEIRDEILAGRIPLEGVRREATVLFADLRGFTSFVESHPPEEVISTMRAYFTAMHRAIRRHGGLVLQFVGDEIEAVFGVPVHLEGHADAAVKASMDMRRALDQLNRERQEEGKPPLGHGIGIHSGPILAGNSGSEEQAAYSLIGDTVNIASRIQGLTKELGCDVLLSRETAERLKDPYGMEKQKAQWVRGYSKPIDLYKLLD